MERKKVKRILSCLFGGRQKVQVTKFTFDDFIFVVGSAANSVRTTLEFTAFGSGPEAKPSRTCAFWLFLSTAMVFAAVPTHFPKKNTRVYRHTVTCVRNSPNIE